MGVLSTCRVAAHGPIWHNRTQKRLSTEPFGALIVSTSITVAWSEGVADEETATLLATLERTLQSLFLRVPAALEGPPITVRAYGNWIIPALAPDRPYWGVQWYVDSSWNSGVGRIIAPSFLELVRQEPWQQSSPHYDLALLDADLTDFTAPLARLRPERYTVGTSLPGTAGVLSVRRIRTLASEPTQRLALARLVRHMLGHVLGAPSFHRAEHTVREGLELHCTNRCVMRGAATVEELSERAIDEAELGWPYCPECTYDLLNVVIRHALDWN